MLRYHQYSICFWSWALKLRFMRGLISSSSFLRFLRTTLNRVRIMTIQKQHPATNIMPNAIANWLTVPEPPKGLYKVPAVVYALIIPRLSSWRNTTVFFALSCSKIRKSSSTSTKKLVVRSDETHSPFSQYGECFGHNEQDAPSVNKVPV